MCTTYRAPGEEVGLSELRIDNFGDLFRRTPWKLDVYTDYPAPIIAHVDGRFEPLVAGFGYWPRALQKVNIEKAKEEGKKPPPMRSTMNARDGNLGKSPLYGPAWRGGRRCLIPAEYIIEPSYPDARQDAKGDWINGACVWQRIGVADRPTMCVAGIWRTLTNQDGAEYHAMSMITVNADDHPLMSRMHKPADEKRSVVILRPDDWEEWLTTSNVEAARAMLQLYPADEMYAKAK
ncbi:gp33 [Burkholderia lata]|uniref:SOS response-associated peptidase family protein n=1 Tax=Burkholderia lata (strain ATCC 17760 / DSM 23089 / LMG 22485 / NCIMB 9086 / R18194 / 383) TaxID=482957 RepID=UPI0014543194|nr:SOS response-associated peptidase family protein [Burkholderia lata]VWB15342.1 gp33 [Burkholderia lata]